MKKRKTPKNEKGWPNKMRAFEKERQLEL